MKKSKRRTKREILCSLFIFWVLALLIQQLMQYIDDNKEEQELKNKISSYINRSLKLPIAAYPSWVHGVWLHIPVIKDSSVGTFDLVRQFLNQNISLDIILVEHGGIIFSQNAASFHRFKGLVEKFHDMNLRVVTSIDSFVHQGNLEFDECKKRSLLLLPSNNGIVHWEQIIDDTTSYINKGGLLDFFNSEAVRLYRKRMDLVLQTGVNGVWNEPMDAVLSSNFEHGVQGHGGFVDSAIYANDYYYQTFDYGREKKGFEFITSFIPVDFFLRDSMVRSFGPTDISFATFIRNHPFSFKGLEDAIFSLEQSVEKGYINVGIEPYGSLNGGADVILRWLQLQMLCPLASLPLSFLNKVEIRFPTQFKIILSEVRRLINLHKEFKPYFFSLGSLMFFYQFQHRSNQSENLPEPFVIRPTNIEFKKQCHGFKIGTELFFAPVIKSEVKGNENLQEIQEITVNFPNDLGPWVPHKTSNLPFTIYNNGSVEKFFINATQILLFQRVGGIIPMQILSLLGVISLLIQSPHLGLYPVKYIPLEEVEGNLSDISNKEFVIFYSEIGKRHLLWYSIEYLDDYFWLNINGTAFGVKMIVCVRGVSLIMSDTFDIDGDNNNNGYERANSLAHFNELVALDTSVIFTTEEEVYFYSSLMTVESVARIGPLKGTE